MIFDFSVGIVISSVTGTSPLSFTGLRNTLIPSLDTNEYAFSVVEQEERIMRDTNRIRSIFFIRPTLTKETSLRRLFHLS